MSKLRIVLALVSLLLPSAALACLWDYDTILQERSRFPDALEIITGKFLRHSQEYYYWRISDRTQRLQHDPDNLPFHDDLAVAYDKIGDQQKAIELMLAAMKKKPGRYETEANLGTFYIHAGQLQKGLEHIDEALRINPSAHFGREKFQKLLTEYVLAGRAQPEPEPPGGSFDAFLEKGKGYLPQPDRQEAIKGILGIMRFSNFESPLLLESLVSLLSGRAALPEHDAKQLAARAYLKASYVVPDKDKQAYRDMAQHVLHLQVGSTLESLEASFQRELAEAKAWHDRVRQDELDWIAAGKDADVEFTRKYYGEPAVSVRWSDYLEYLHDPYRTAALAAFAVALIATAALWFRRWRKRRNANTLLRNHESWVNGRI